MGEITLFLGSDIDHNTVIWYMAISVKLMLGMREHSEVLKVHFSFTIYSEIWTGEILKHECKYYGEQSIIVGHAYE